MKKLKSNILVDSEVGMKMSTLRGEFEEFQRSLRDAEGKLPRHFSYPKELIERVVTLKGYGLSGSGLADALGLSHGCVSSWLNSRKKRKSLRVQVKLGRELKVRDVDGILVDNVRIILQSGIRIEVSALTENLIRCLNGVRPEVFCD